MQTTPHANDAPERGATPLRRHGVRCRSFDGEAVLYDPAHNTVHYLNPTACFIWNCCDGVRGIDDITGALARTFELSEQSADADLLVRGDVRNTLSQLADNGLIDFSP
jgi:hypothetical protein